MQQKSEKKTEVTSKKYNTSVEQKSDSTTRTGKTPSEQKKKYKKSVKESMKGNDEENTIPANGTAHQKRNKGANPSLDDLIG